MKTKSLRRIVTAVMAVLFLFTTPAGLAQIVATPAESPYPIKMPVGSLGELKAFAIEKINRVYTWTSAPVIADASNNGYVAHISDGQSPLEFVKSALQNTFRFRIVDLRDIDDLSLSATATSADGDLLFFGNEIPTANPSTDGVWRFTTKMTLHLAEYTPIEIGEASFATLYYRENGDMVSWPIRLGIADGKMYFPSRYAGVEGQLLINYQNGEGRSDVVAYDLATGKKTNPIQVEGKSTGAIDNTYDWAFSGANPTGDTPAFGFVDATANMGDTPPVVRITIRGVGKVALSIASRIPMSGTYVSPDSVAYRPEGGTQWTNIPISGSGFVHVDLVPGVYYVALEHSSYHKLRQQPSYQDSGAGPKG